MDSKILFGKILQRFKDLGKAQVEEYNSFCYIRETENAVIVTRESGEDTSILFLKILLGIETYKIDPMLYSQGPSALRDIGITHVNSPIWSLLHLLNGDEYL
jgi:hypothetical protein